METLVYRYPHSARVYVGGFMVTASVPLAAYLLVPNYTTGLRLNDGSVVSPPVLVFSFFFYLTAVLLSALVLLRAAFEKVVLTPEGIRYYTLTNKLAVEAAWSEVKPLERSASTAPLTTICTNRGSFTVMNTMESYPYLITLIERYQAQAPEPSPAV